MASIYIKHGKGRLLDEDLINTPASDMGPSDLAACAKDIADRFNAECIVTIGDSF